MPPAADRREKFTGRGIEDGCNGRYALLDERHREAEFRQASHERARPIDRIDDPDS
jgi:hypothetical protein